MPAAEMIADQAAARFEVKILLQRRSIEQPGAFFILVSPAVFVAPTDHYGQKKNGLG